MRRYFMWATCYKKSKKHCRSIAKSHTIHLTGNHPLALNPDKIHPTWPTQAQKKTVPGANSSPIWCIAEETNQAHLFHQIDCTNECLLEEALPQKRLKGIHWRYFLPERCTPTSCTKNMVGFLDMTSSDKYKCIPKTYRITATVDITSIECEVTRTWSKGYIGRILYVGLLTYTKRNTSKSSSANIAPAIRMKHPKCHSYLS